MACPELLLPRRRGHSPSALLQARGCQCRSLYPSQSSLFGHLGAYMKSLGISPKLLAQEVAAGADEWVPDSLKDLIFLRSWRKLTQSRSGNLTLKARRRDSPNQPGEVERGRVETGKSSCAPERPLIWGGETGSLVSSREKLYPPIDPQAPPPTLAVQPAPADASPHGTSSPG